MFVKRRFGVASHPDTAVCASAVEKKADEAAKLEAKIVEVATPLAEMFAIAASDQSVQALDIVSQAVAPPDLQAAQMPDTSMTTNPPTASQTIGKITPAATIPAPIAKPKAACTTRRR